VPIHLFGLWCLTIKAEGIAVTGEVVAQNSSPIVVISTPDIPEPRQAEMLEWLAGEAFGSLETGLSKQIRDLR
jgi:Ser/Thr protein kinase RdoA (MazF antagonist)